MVNFFNDLEKLRVRLEEERLHQASMQWPIKVDRQDDDSKRNYSLQIGNSHETHFFKILSVEKEARLGEKPKLFVVYDITLANNRRRRYKEAEIKRRVGLLKEIMGIDQKHKDMIT